MKRIGLVLRSLVVLTLLAGGCSKKPADQPDVPPELKAKAGTGPRSGPIPIEK
jgi:hypothetical protein